MSLAALLLRLKDDRRTQALLGRYLLIGGFSFALNYAVLQTLLHLHAAEWAAWATAFLASLVAHFTLNRFLNFRNFERTIVQQAGTYAVVAGLCGIVQIALGPLLLRVLPASKLSSLIALAIVVAVNVPVGFLGHRYLTFGAGIAATLRRLRA